MNATSNVFVESLQGTSFAPGLDALQNPLKGEVASEVHAWLRDVISPAILGTLFETRWRVLNHG